jgi:VanZ family protein
LVAGLLTGYRLVSFRIFNLTLIKKCGRYQFCNFTLNGTGGQCLMSPPDKPLNQINTRWYNLGGILANILIATVALIAFKSHTLPLWADTLMLMFAIIGFLYALVNGLPLKLNGIGNDGYNILHLEKTPKNKRLLCHMLRANAMIQEGIQPKDLPEELFVAEDIDWSDGIQANWQIMVVARMENLHQWEEAYDKLSEAIDAKDRILKLFYNELAIEMVFICLVTGRTDEAQKLYTADLRKYVNTFSRTQSGKQRIAFTAKLLLDNNPEEAQKLLCNLKERQNQYLLQGETLMDVEIMEWLWNKHSCPDNPSFTTIQ